MIQESGNSSYKFLQNVYADFDYKNQAVSLGLAMSEMILKDHGVCRVHGGGFAGTIQAFVENGYVETYKEEIEKVILVAVSLDDSNDADESLDELEEQFHLSKPYLSKYIKEKSGKTFGELVKNVRMKKARTLLKGGNMTVESIAEKVGYQNVEHFTRLFKKKYGMTPVQFRNEEK